MEEQTKKKHSHTLWLLPIAYALLIILPVVALIYWKGADLGAVADILAKVLVINP